VSIVAVIVCTPPNLDTKLQLDVVVSVATAMCILIKRRRYVSTVTTVLLLHCCWGSGGLLIARDFALQSAVYDLINAQLYVAG
jgi:hypothetical protein